MPTPAASRAHLGSAGPCTTDDLKVELALDARRYQRARRILEQRGVLIARHITVDTEGGGHRHLSELTRWDQLVDTAADHVPETALDDLLVAVVEAAVVVPASDAQRAFTWTIPTAVVDAAVDAGPFARLDDDYLAAR